MSSPLSSSSPTKIYSVLFIAAVAHFMVDFMIGIWPIYKTMVHLDLAKAGMIAAICAFMGEGMQMLFGSLSDRGYRKMLILGGTLVTTASTLLAYTENYYLLFLIYIVTCIGSGAFHPSAVGLVGGLSQNRKGLFITIFATSGAIGLAASQLVFSNIYHTFNAHTVVLMLPVMIIVGLACFKHFPSHQHVEGKPVQTHGIKGLFQFFKIRSLRLLYIIQMCNSVLYWGTMFLLPDVLLSRGYEHWFVFGGGHMCYILGGALVMVPAGYLSDKYSARSVMIYSTIVGMVAFYAFFLNVDLSTVSAMILLLVIGASFGLVSPVLLAFANQVAPNNPGLVSAFLMGFVWCISECVGPGGGGLLTKFFEDDAPAKAMMVLGVLTVGAIAASFRLPRVAVEPEVTAAKEIVS
jgi:FSR family fosmidomycin resistance protein-like MFS transporter